MSGVSVAAAAAASSSTRSFPVAATRGGIRAASKRNSKQRAKQPPTPPVRNSVLASGGGESDGGGGDDDDNLEMEDAFDEDDFEFECIPLKSVYTMSGEDEDEEGVYFLDEFGNYVFPVSSTTGTLGGTGSVSMRTAGGGGGGGGGGCGSCSCGPQAGDELDIATSIRRRQSQVIASYSYSTHGRQQMFTGPGSDFLEKIFR